jgi:hypothetical protein
MPRFRLFSFADAAMPIIFRHFAFFHADTPCHYFHLRFHAFDLHCLMIFLLSLFRRDCRFHDAGAMMATRDAARDISPYMRARLHARAVRALFSLTFSTMPPLLPIFDCFFIIDDDYYYAFTPPITPPAVYSSCLIRLPIFFIIFDYFAFHADFSMPDTPLSLIATIRLFFRHSPYCLPRLFHFHCFRHRRATLPT